MEIKREERTVCDVCPKDSSCVTEEIMGEHTLTLNFLSRHAVDLRINDHVDLDGTRYKIRHNEKVTKKETSLGWEYSVQLYASRYDLSDVEFFLHGTPERKKNLDYYTATARDWLALLVKNMNRTESGWETGSCVESRMITLSFKDKKAGTVLDELAKELDTEYWISGKTINIGRREYASEGLVLAQGEGMGFAELEVSAVDETPPVTVLYPYGSDKNIGPDYGADYLLLPGGRLSIERNVERYGRIEKSKQFDHVFPKGEFTVTERIDDHTLRASGIDFDLADCLLDGVEAVVTFQDGGLAGYDLAIAEGGWDNATKSIRLKPNQRENALRVPGDINFAVGDRFILTGIRMPAAYVEKAEALLLEEAGEWLAARCEKRVKLRAKCDEATFRQRGITVGCGQMVGVYSRQLGIDREIRATKVKRYIGKDGALTYRHELTLSDFLEPNGLKDLAGDVSRVPEEIEDRVRPLREYTKRSWRDVMETLGMMFDPEGDYFTELIKPLAVHTARLVVGANSQQMDLVGVRFTPNADNDPNYLKSTAGKLAHFTIDEDKVREWAIPASSHRLEGERPYYVYARCPKEGDTGSIVVSERQIRLMDDPGHYHFWVGTLNTPEDNVRSWSPNYGYTEIAGQTITTGVIKDKAARLAIDLAKGTVTGPVTFSPGTTGYGNIADRPDLTPLYNGVRDSLSAAEEASAAANRARGEVDAKARVFYSNYAPSGARDNDLWVDGVNIYRWDARSGGWALASKYDNTETRINGGLITTGAIAFGSTGGMAGSGTIRIWSGGQAVAGGLPPRDPTFRVMGDGDVESRGSIYIANPNGYRLAGFSGLGTADGSVRIWAGGTNPGIAPFRVTQDGSIYATRGKIGRFDITGDSRLIWNQSGYFGGLSRSLKLGYSSGNEGVIDVTFDGATEGRFGVKAVGRANGSAAIYGSSRNASTFPDSNQVWAGWFDGLIFSEGYFARRPNGKLIGGRTEAVRMDNSDTWLIFSEGIYVGYHNARAVEPKIDNFNLGG